MTWLHASSLYLKKHIVTCYSATVFSIFFFLQTQTWKKKIRLLTKRGTSFLAGFCSLYDLAEAVIADRILIWDLRRVKKTNGQMQQTIRLLLSLFANARAQTYTCARTHTHTCTHTIPSLQHRRILIEWQETRTERAGKDMMSATTNNKRCKGASFPKLFQKCKMGTKTLHFLLRAELSESALLQHPR